MLRQFSTYLNSNDFFTDSQFGIWQGFSTAYAVMDLLDRIYVYIARGSVVFAFLLDFTFAFDSIYPSCILRAMSEPGTHSASLRWLTSAFAGRSFRVEDGDRCSAWFFVFRGFGQGNQMGPFFFIVTINGVPRALPPGTRAHLFADDVSVETAHPQLVLGRLQTVLVEVAAQTSGLFWPTYSWELRTDAMGCQVGLCDPLRFLPTYIAKSWLKTLFKCCYLLFIFLPYCVTFLCFFTRQIQNFR